MKRNILPVDFLLPLNRIIFRRNNSVLALEEDDAVTVGLNRVRSRNTIGSEITTGKRKGNAKQNVARMKEKRERYRRVGKRVNVDKRIGKISRCPFKSTCRDKSRME